MYLTPEVKDNYIFLENTPRKICLLIGLKLSFYKIDTNTELAQVVEVILAQTKRIHILMIKKKTCCFLFCHRMFYEEIKTCSLYFYRVLI